MFLSNDKELLSEVYVINWNYLLKKKKYYAYEKEIKEYNFGTVGYELPLSSSLSHEFHLYKYIHFIYFLLKWKTRTYQSNVCVPFV